VWGTGSQDSIWTQTSDSATAGPGSGGGGGGGLAAGGGNGGAAGSYGGGGGGAGEGDVDGTGGVGKQGIIVITYTPAAASTAPDAPTNLVSTSVTGAVSLSWTAPASSGSSNLETYGVWRATSPFTATTSATLIASFATSSGTSYSDSSALHGSIYYYRVTATNGTATSSLSNQKSSGSNSGRIIRLAGMRLH
jgi:hypothetical protein